MFYGIFSRIYRAPEGEAGGADASGGGGASGGAEGGGSGGAGDSGGADGGGDGGGAGGAGAGALFREGGSGDAGGDGGGGDSLDSVPDWAKGFDPETRSVVAKKGWSSPEALLESYKRLETKLGTPEGQLLKMAKIEDRDAWHGADGIFAKLGRPESPGDYKAPENLTLAEGEQDLTKDFAQHAFDIGMSQQMYESTVEWFNNGRTQRLETARTDQSAKQAKELKAVQVEWGADWEANVGIARKGMAALGLDQEKATALENIIGTRELMMRMHSIGSMLGEHAGGAHGSGQDAGYMSPEEAKSEIDTLKADTDFMNRWTDPELPGHADAQKKMTALMELAFPGS